MREPGLRIRRGQGRLALGMAIAGTCALANLPATGYPAPGPAPGTDPSTGLIESPGWDLVRAQCGGCHSYGLIANQRGDRETWLAIIRWMQETQNFWDLGNDVEGAILDYLAANYPPRRNHRRAPIPDRLMPEPASR